MPRSPLDSHGYGEQARRWTFLQRPKKEVIAPGIERTTVGKGVTERTRIDAIFGVASAEDIGKFRPNISRSNPFEGKYVSLEQDAQKILENAGLPSTVDALPEEAKVPSLPKTFSEYFSFFDRLCAPEDLQTGLREYVETRGYRELEDREWFAAAFLDATEKCRAAVKRGTASYACLMGFELGEIATEYRIRFGPVAEVARKGGKQRGQQITKQHEPVKTVVLAERKRLEKESDRSAAKIIAKKMGIPEGTVRGILRRAEKKVD